MALKNKAADVLASNQLDISILVISNAQAWKEQVLGAYHLLYPEIVEDFPHRNDVQEWVDEVFAKHGHAVAPGCQGSAITQITLGTGSGGEKDVGSLKGKEFNEVNKILGKVKKGISDLSYLVQKFKP
jgi:hypothetical protein